MPCFSSSRCSQADQLVASWPTSSSRFAYGSSACQIASGSVVTLVSSAISPSLALTTQIAVVVAEVSSAAWYCIGGRPLLRGVTTPRPCAFPCTMARSPDAGPITRSLIFSLQIRRLRTNNYSDYACKRNASRLHPALPATCRDRVAGVLLICNQAAKFLERQCLRASLNDATPWQQNDAVIAHQEPDIRIASAHWMFDDWLQPRSWTAFVSAFGSIIVTL